MEVNDMSDAGTGSRRTVGLAAALAMTVLGVAWLAVADNADNGAGGDRASRLEGSMVALTGTIEPVAGDSGAPQAIQIVSPTHGSFLIQDSGKGADLRALVGEEVTITARRERKVAGRWLLSVQRYSIHEG